MSLPAVVALIVLALTSGSPQKRKSEVREVKAIGCVRKAVEAGCLLLTTLDGKTTYVIFAATPPEPGMVITMDGKPHAGPTSCMQGIAIDVTNWEETGEKCTR